MTSLLLRERVLGVATNVTEHILCRHLQVEKENQVHCLPISVTTKADSSV